MAVEDHPLYPEWSRRLERLKKASQDLQDVIDRGAPQSEIDAARSSESEAQTSYNNIADRIE